jgi:hypothetical protein
LWYDANDHFGHYGHERIGHFSPEAIEHFLSTINGVTDDFRYLSDNILRPSERRRKIGAGIRNWGFMNKTSELANTKPEFAEIFDLQSFNNCIKNIADCRSLITCAQTLIRVVTDSMMTYSNEAYSFSLLYYQTVRQLAQRDVPGALEVFRQLQPFFRRPRNTQAQPTAKQIERDMRALLHGKKDGKIVVENEMPHLTEGKRELIDDVHKPHGAWKETEHGTICEHCGCENHGHHRFCHGCGKELRMN